MRPEVLCGLLAEPERLRVFAALVLGATTPSEAAAGSGLPAREVVRALRRLEQGGLVNTREGRLVADLSAFKEAHRVSRPPDPDQEAEQAGGADPLDPDRQRATVLRAFIRDGRLVAVPVARTKRRVVLEHLVTCFEPGVRYPERAVDAILRAWYEDYVSLRRHLIDEGLMTRDRGVYWRTGGYVEVV